MLYFQHLFEQTTERYRNFETGLSTVLYGSFEQNLRPSDEAVTLLADYHRLSCALQNQIFFDEIEVCETMPVKVNTSPTFKTPRLLLIQVLTVVDTSFLFINERAKQDFVKILLFDYHYVQR